MKFTRLRLSGFKSFCDRTELPIDDGLTGVVGPNGCGKSNLVEALRWVMGETSAKRMRGAGMDDLIFAGSTSRPGRNFAEVVISLDNAARQAPGAFNDADEIEISRRIDREAGSTYRVNGREVRARDVQTFFADLASGPQSPAFVRQGRIGQLIDAKPADRRMVLEEAAGIAGLHARRHEAELRLRAAEQNLVRVEDVVETIEAQLTALKRQARQASRYRKLSDQVRRLEALVLHMRWQEAGATADHSAAEARRLTAEVAEATRLVSELTRAVETLGEGLTPLRAADAAAGARLQRITLENQRIEAAEQQAVTEIGRLEAALRAAEEDHARERAFLADGEEVLTRLSRESQALEAEEASADAPLQAAGETLGAARTALEEAERDLDARRKALAELTAERASARRRVEEREERRTRLAARLADARSRLTEMPIATDDDDIRRVRAEAEALSAAAIAAGERAEAAEEARRQAQDAERTARDPLSEAERALSALKAEAMALAKLLSVEDGKLWPPVVDAVNVAPGFEAALGAALGEDLNAACDEAAPLHWRLIEDAPHGNALPDGAVPLDSFVDAPAALARRLAQIGVVEASEGPLLQRQLKPGQRLVSRHGDLWRWDGFTVSAEAETPAAKHLAQRNRLKELDGEITHAEAKVRKARDGADEKRLAAEAALLAERDARQRWRDAESALTTAREQLTTAEREAARRQQARAGLEDEIARLTQETAECEAAVSEAERHLAGLASEESLVVDAETQASQVAEARAALTEALGAREALIRDQERRRQRLAEITAETSQWRSRLEAALDHGARLTQRSADLKTQLAEARAQPERLEAERRALASALSEAETARREAADRLAAAEGDLKVSETRRREAEAVLAGLREGLARNTALSESALERAEEAAQRIRETLDCEPAGARALAEIEDEADLPPAEEVESQLDKRKRERDGLGAVNLRAEIEAEESQRQLDELNAEREDLESAIARLREAIGDLNREGRERLEQAFDEVNGHFQRLFKHLFGGGSAELRLVEADDPLAAGLEIYARPPGKRLQTISLLSGGEQALTALSLIFAVFLTNPSPICVLDEVDAPLDDTNVERFCNLLIEMRRLTNTRFVIITHHPLTMSRLDRLFGVTMAERGVSQLVSVDLADAEQMRAAG